MYLYSVVIHYLYVFGARFRPAKTDAPLIIDANAVLSEAVALQRFKAIARRHPQIIQAARDLKLSELSLRHGSDAYKSPDALALGQRLCLGAPERHDHAL
jgi:hypothetical protein